MYKKGQLMGDYGMTLIEEKEREPIFNLDDWERKELKVQDSDIVINAAIADTDDLRTEGLLGVKKLADGEGLLFMHEQEGIWPYHTEGMAFDLDMIYMDSSGKVVDITQATANSGKLYTASGEKTYQYVLELPSGYSISNGIEIGSIILIEGKNE